MLYGSVNSRAFQAFHSFWFSRRRIKYRIIIIIEKTDNLSDEIRNYWRNWTFRHMRLPSNFNSFHWQSILFPNHECRLREKIHSNFFLPLSHSRTDNEIFQLKPRSASCQDGKIYRIEAQLDVKPIRDSLSLGNQILLYNNENANYYWVSWKIKRSLHFNELGHTMFIQNFLVIKKKKKIEKK